VIATGAAAAVVSVAAGVEVADPWAFVTVTVYVVLLSALVVAAVV
jgi:hypothetical protein